MTDLLILSGFSMASSVKGLGSKMADALSCPICFLSYDQESRLPKVFPCQHTVCLQCANELCQRHYDDVFPCPTCRQSITIPCQGGSGFQTNLDVRNIVEIVQGTDMMGGIISYPRCTHHSSKPISHVCMECKVGLCSKCISSPAMRDHVSHQVMDIDDAFQEIKKTCGEMIERGEEIGKQLNERDKKIKSSAASLRAALQSNHIVVFERMDAFRDLLDISIATAGKRSISSIDITTADDLWDDAIVKSTRRLLKSGSAALNDHCGSGKPESVICAKMTAVTAQIDILRLKLHYRENDGLDSIINDIVTLCDESENCCRRVIDLDGHMLLLSCLQRYKFNVPIIGRSLEAIGNLAEQRSIQIKLISAELVKSLTDVIENYTMVPLIEHACRTLSSFLCNPTLVWPKSCPSRAETGDLVIHTCKNLDNNEPIQGQYGSFKPHMIVLSQHFSEAAKYWPIWTVYRYVMQKPRRYVPMLVANGGIAVLQQLENSHDYVKRLAKEILKKI